MPLFRTRALVLKVHYLSDTDKLVTFFTERYGKVKAVAKGARRLKSRYGASLEPLTLVSLIYFGKEHQDLFRVNQCDIVSFHQEIRDSLDTFFYALYFIELLDSLTAEGHCDTEVFAFATASLEALNPEQNPELLCRIFELRLLSLLGYRPRLEQCVKCRKFPRSHWVGFSYNSQGIFCAPCLEGNPVEARIKLGTLQYLKRLLTHDLQRWTRLKIPKDTEQELEQFTHRLVLARLGRELKSYPLLKQMTQST
ncbi:MAG: DNA repair protein RecO [Candidatus Nitronauta litoralis]|uniref:DNA repair protein RecO n=1 Tax=Candidatus Nitronauta litoralis TaxID=2705533 RepID=A0A7T0G1A4_9BACT|nr:MAG: DNA repair protein RecO [Candidatus Nitronauta litoralis]